MQSFRTKSFIIITRWFILRRSGLNISLIVVNYVNNRHEEDPPVSVEA
jgi:hypothetical protein